MNYIAARGDGKLCLAFMNASDRQIDRVNFTLNSKYFQSLDGEVTARVWKDNKPVETPVNVKYGMGVASLSPKGITAVCIDGLSPRVSFQDKLRPSQTATARRIVHAATPFGDLEGMILSFGPELSWFYLYLKSRPDDVRHATLSWTIGERNGSATDPNFPFEFSIPLQTSADPIRFSVSMKTADSKTVVFSDDVFQKAKE